MKPVKSRIRAWVEALRSGKFKQAHGHLRSSNGRTHSYCCLGVACEIYRRETGKGRWWLDAFLDSDDYLPIRVQKWFGFNSKDPVLLGSRYVNRTGARMNDTGSSFETIADAIEKKFLAKE